VPALEGGPRLIPTPTTLPEPGNRTTARPVYQATYVQLAGAARGADTVVPAAAITVPSDSRGDVDDGGWRASHD
jgi:hypothetical protein